MYKVLANVLANRLRKVVSSMISDSHFPFIKGRQIHDRVLIVNGVVDEARKLKKGTIVVQS